MHSLSQTLRHAQFREGVREMSGVTLGIAAWGLVTGVAMVKGGLSIPLALLMTFVVYAGSAQLAALPLMMVGTPVWVIWATALCINLRFVIFSAQWRPYFMRYGLRDRLVLGYVSGDLTYVLFMKRFPEARDDEGQIEYFMGAASANWLSWQIPVVVGILLADVIPTHWGLGFAGVLALLGLTYSLISDRATALAAVVAGAAAVAAFALPLRLHIVVAIAAAVCVGLMIDGGGDAGRRLRAALERARPSRPRESTVEKVAT
ncbi:AzlC family ABC transporter permease [Piscinibacter sp. HJYY11]|uniref:AzlC family ABC transporter permease n=1 Tax=Piscinibacter sp. HJYY11 TaxID=2801333 RepID=UPI00191D0C57|nr:AzlC family ABC transporter permease [Piscinibacter sp. HJYY11]MBL0729758.1 AzlC family ABC transporter permease [Piscinibacter sp. HJYY11]